jgi:hypothetical protein
MMAGAAIGIINVLLSGLTKLPNLQLTSAMRPCA